MLFRGEGSRDLKAPLGSVWKVLGVLIDKFAESNVVKKGVADRDDVSFFGPGVRTF